MVVVVMNGRSRFGLVGAVPNECQNPRPQPIDEGPAHGQT